ncbi:hypothetical protein RU01_15610 [Rhodococcus sp. MEB064]|nr:hypothetical protein RU01_15610 [Rhodococcus sp. MEB064]
MLVSRTGSYEPPPREKCRQKQWEQPYDDANSIRLQFILWRRDGRLVEFVVNIQKLTADGWLTIEYFDCCHGHCHLHRDNAQLPPETVERLDDIADVTTAFGKVESQVHDRVRIIRDKGA